MPAEATVAERVEKAASTVGPVWPLHDFVTANPLAGFEDLPFDEAVTQAADLLGGRGYPDPAVFRAALEDGRVDRDVLGEELADRGYEADPAALLDRLDTEGDAADPDTDPDVERVDHVLTKWLAAFLDEGRADWPMPNREDGFYAAFRAVVEHDGAVPDAGLVADLPPDPQAAIAAALEPYPESQWVPILEAQLAALPGWAGFVKRRAEGNDEWQSAHPITLAGYLAARLALLDAFGVDPEPASGPDSPGSDADAEIAAAFLQAWEATYREALVDAVQSESEAGDATADGGRPDAQLVFCIDTRSERIRRQVEAAGDYETFGYAGFFGVPMAYEGYDDEVAAAACPPVVDPEHRVTEVPADRDTQATHDRWKRLREAAGRAVETLRSNPATAFSFVEGTGSGYGLALAARTLVPGRVADLLGSADDAVPDGHEFCEQLVQHQHTHAGGLPVGLTREEQVEYAATAFDLLGWEEFGRLAVFVGHASETANNPYESSLHCGACAGNPGGPNARVLAAICNDEAVREDLRERGHDVPADTVFLAAEHTTTTDEVTLFDDAVPESHADDLAGLREDLGLASDRAAAERADALGDAAGADAPAERAADWAEVRPEWGLAGNAGFVVGPRALTRDLDLDGRAFLHDYDWATDPESEALEPILAGPVVVGQWINAQYYFSTVDNTVYGAGSKVTQNPVGNVGVQQGNGGDLMAGLPRQSLYADADTPYHQPLRLSTVVHAPVERVTEVLADADDVTQLLDNEWLSLTVVDPTQDHRAFRYAGELAWEPAREAATRRPALETPATADD